MQRQCLALDLKDNPELIEKYEEYHRDVWPDILTSIKESGIQEMQIYRVGNRMFMIIEADDDFSFEKKAIIDAKYADNEKWEELMWKYQQALPFAKPGEKWMPMKKVFQTDF
ncbi:L-rhamnose mutarotase [Aurantibacter crassamenti]|uniref:L-rhamnose mutarotase n=1 Tax=Aurantibacter crassamenti TaxID=1837375 RepID=UPI00193A317C|nr:L-rhamnose mutarotase [Aurantibacter crassamenti]MBM1106192.1 L-rhamnose mutarotase [Aurantibacter crassamenti]